MPKLIMLIGLPGSGKSTVAKAYIDCAVHSSDEVRQRLYGSAEVQDNPQKVFELLEKEIFEDLGKGVSCIYDATNLSYKRRKDFVSRLQKKYPDVDRIAMVLTTPFEMCVTRNLQRERQVPYEVLLRMRERFDPPYYNEGWQYIVFIKQCVDTPIESMAELIAYMQGVEQDNPHHSLDLLNHCLECYRCLLYCGKKPPDYVTLAALFHDFGKYYTKSFQDSKGKVSDIAHFYNHENVGSYEILCRNFGISDEALLKASYIVRWHMLPYVWEKDNNTRLHEKYKTLWGEELYKDIMWVHEADRLAH